MSAPDPKMEPPPSPRTGRRRTRRLLQLGTGALIVVVLWALGATAWEMFQDASDRQK
jgi:hypothetical protein